MPHFVFANNNEIAAKSADGASLACQPDVCFSPGAPTPGVPVPYANSVFARDLDNLSRTVLIKGTGAALEDKSYFATSYGDEPATSGLQKGIISGKIKGKAYFKSWSMDVKIEGRGVARHMDTVTHNHVNQANVISQKYRSVWEKDPKCAQDRNKVKENCKPKDPDKESNKKRKRKGLLQKLTKVASLPDEMAKKALAYRKNINNSWLDDYCDGLWVKPTNQSRLFEDAKSEIKNFLAQDKWTLAQEAFSELMALAKEQLSPWFLLRKGGGLALRSVLKEGGALVTGATGVGLVVSAGLTAWTIADVVETATEIARELGPEGLEILDEITNIASIEEKLKDKLEQWTKDPARFMADAMSAMAIADACIRDRKCMLVPFNKTDSISARSGEGCCPGQTGHHVMPGAMFGRNSKTRQIDPEFKGACGKDDYDHRNAPTICLEGTNQSHGSHGKAHTALSEIIEKYKTINQTDRISYGKARDFSLNALKLVAPHCDPDCLRAQLDAYYKDCDKGEQKNLKATAGEGGAKKQEVEPAETVDY